ncbi:MAG: hypothetical protein M3Q45_11715 [Chloroflexota bacterium]|nr:hypothetical protein [Chloroflexota bacterium]
MPVELSLEDLTPVAQAVLARAQQQATQHGAPTVEPSHLLLGLLNGPPNLAIQQLNGMGIDLAQLSTTLRTGLPPAQDTISGDRSLSSEAQQVVRSAFKEAVHLSDRRVDALHLLHGLLYQPDGPAYAALSAAGVSLYELRQQALQKPKRFHTRYQDSLRAVIRPSPVFGGLVVTFIACGVVLWMGPGEVWVGPVTTVFVLAGWIIAVCIHEFGHALVAYLGGDSSVKAAGYLTLNPLRYSHPLLSIVLPVVFLLMGGLGLPGGAVYIRPGALRSALWEISVSAAGPLGTLLFMLLVGWPFFFDRWDWITLQNFYFWQALSLLTYLQVTSLMLNLLPIPPLDGYRMLAPGLPPAVRQAANAVGSFGFLILFMLLRQDSPLSEPFWTASYRLALWLHIPLDLTFAGFDQFEWWKAYF